MRRRRPRSGLSIAEILLAAGMLLLVLTLLWAALDMVLRGTGKAEWLAQAERDFESFAHVLSEEVHRANHLITTEPGGRRVHDPRFSAVWIREDGDALVFRVFRADQEVSDVENLDVEALVQDRIFFLNRENRLVFLRRGKLGAPDTRVLLENVREVNFSAGAPYETMGPLGGLLQVKLRMRQPGGETSLVRELSVRTGVPVLEEHAEPSGEEFLPPPQASISPYNR